MLVEKRESGFLFRSVDFSTYLHTLLITEYTYIYMYDCFVIGTYRCVNTKQENIKSCIREKNYGEFVDSNNQRLKIHDDWSRNMHLANKT